ncbi:hypothetical protein SFC27_05570 [Bacillus licheniformis]|uniref:hypothetical protein n=1 Tax=Bacillus TaxID=1386 RepID=UPI00038E648E|nr:MULTISPECIES: hypothetical protein [Bacillus]MDP4080039.1 hypothetical protein [Bacillota bacterium]ARC60457.1 hypothetical protein BaDB11_01815 [Bacillus licheniformis]ARC63860.1 hypothetical protein B14_00835 [Bacillus licheniformis]AVI47111.1 hypothetical protein BL14DL4_01882 [Bacillus licheniformis]EQM26347.1 hypothetical protein N399_19835 [Bacillus licheniformis CG-B52]
MEKQNKSTPAATEAELLLEQLKTGIISVNDVRVKLGLKPLPIPEANKKFLVI